MLRIFALSFMILLFSCSEDSGTGPGDNGGVSLGNLKMDVDGSNWAATAPLVFATVSISENQGALSVSATKIISQTQSQAIAISVGASVNNASDLEGTYALDGTGIAAIAFSISNSQNFSTYISTDGEVTINKITESNVTGVFSATCVNTLNQEDEISITDGVFNASLTLP
jgi:hypothetical protein